MKRMGKKRLFVFAGALALGVLLHFFHGWVPCAVTAAFSPVRESLWEHVKIVFWPLLLAGALLSGGDRGLEAAWKLSALVSSMLMLLAGYVYHILLGGEWVVFDLVLYAAAVGAGFLFPRCFWRLAEHSVPRGAATLLCCVMAVLLLWFSFRPPEHILFADLSGGVRTFLTIPV